MTTPGFEVASGTTTVRTNLAAYPNFDYSGTLATIRTNLCTDPRGIFNTSGYGAQTITTNVAITGHPEGIATAVRIAYTGTDINPGLNILNPLVSGTQYTVSAWVYHETSGGGSQGLAQAGVASMPSPPAIVTGVWNRISWTFTASGTSQVGFRVSSNTAAGSFLITGMMVEAMPALSPYFDGTFPAATRTNLIPSPSAANSNGWFGACGIPATTSTNNAGGPLGTRFARVAITGTGTGTNYFAIAQGSTTSSMWAPATPGNTYTLSAYVRATMVNYQQPKLRMRWKNAAGTTIADEPIVSATGTTSGQWVRISTTGTAPAGTVYVELMGGFVSIDQSTLVVGDTVDVSAALLEVGTALGAYFDGASSGAGGISYGWRGTANASVSYAQDSSFTYGWNGTANASTSKQVGTNLGGWAAATQAITYQSVVDPAQGTKCAAVITKGANGDGLFHNDIAITANTAYTASAWVKITAALPNFTILLRWKDSPSNTLRDDNLTVQTSLVVGSWVRVSVTATSPAGATLLQLIPRILATHTPTLFYIDGVCANEGLETTYFDGSTPASGDFTYAWTGTAGQSTSIQTAPTVSGMTGNYSNRVAYQSADWAASGSKSLCVPGFRPSVDSFSQFNNSAVFGSAPLANRTFTFMAKLKTLESFPVGADGRAWSFHITYNRSGGGTGLINCKPVTTGAQVHTIQQTVTFPSDATTVAFMRFYNGTPNNVPVYWDDVMIVEGEYTGDFINPTQNVLAKWDGTANASTSVGYPPQLLDIAGKPLHNSIDPAAGATYTIPSGPVTIYTVQSIRQTTNNPGYWEYSTNGAWGSSTGIARLIGSLPNMGRLDLMKTNASSTNTSVPLDPMNFAVTATALDPASTTEFQGNGGATYSVATDALFRGTLGGTLKLGVRDNGYPGGNTVLTKRVLVYTGSHDQPIRQAIARYLGNKYGVAVA